MSYHITPDGPKKCEATIKTCKYSQVGDGQHFDTVMEAETAYQRKMIDTFGEVKVHSRKQQKLHRRYSRQDRMKSQYLKVADSAATTVGRTAKALSSPKRAVVNATPKVAAYAKRLSPTEVKADPRAAKALSVAKAVGMRTARTLTLAAQAIEEARNKAAVHTLSGYSQGRKRGKHASPSKTIAFSNYLKRSADRIERVSSGGVSEEVSPVKVTPATVAHAGSTRWTPRPLAESRMASYTRPVGAPAYSSPSTSKKNVSNSAMPPRRNKLPSFA